MSEERGHRSGTLESSPSERPPSLSEKPTKILAAPSGQRQERGGDDGATRRLKTGPDADVATEPAPSVPGVSGVPNVPGAPASTASTASIASGRRSPSKASAEASEEQLRKITASRIGPTILIILGTLPLGLVTVWFARATWLSVAGTVGLLVILGTMLAVRQHWLSTHGDLHRDRYHRIALLMAASAVPMIYAIGTFSGGVTALVTIVVLLYNMSAPARKGLLVTCVVGVPHALLHALIVADVVPDLGVVSNAGDLGPRFLSVLGIVGTYALAFAAGQAIHRRTETTLAELRVAAQQVALREAMLREARLALQEAGGIGQTGRFTDQELGHYVIGAVLGRGGMGEIYEATDKRDQKPVAVELLRPPKAGDDELWQRFEREAHIVASLSSPHVVRVIEVGEEPLPFIAMERLYGKDLALLLRDQSFLSPEEVADMITQCAEGLAAAHAIAIVHRDVKPHNLFRSDDGTWKVLDFGVARLFDGTETVTKNLVGTPGYMAPEQLVSDPERAVDHRADIHALAAVAYRALTGHPAFTGPNVSSVLLAVASKLPEAPSDLAPVPREVSGVLRVALAKDPNDRFDDVRDFADAFARAVLRGEIDPDVTAQAARLDGRLTWRRGA